MSVTINTIRATSFHQQAQQAAPAGCRFETGGSSETGRVSATLYDATGAATGFYRSGPPADVLLELELCFPATGLLATNHPR